MSLGRGEGSLLASVPGATACVTHTHTQWKRKICKNAEIIGFRNWKAGIAETHEWSQGIPWTAVPIGAWIATGDLNSLTYELSPTHYPTACPTRVPLVATRKLSLNNGMAFGKGLTYKAGKYNTL